jgi:hypothetical protein
VSRLYYTVRNPAGMLAVLEPLHEILEAVRMFCEIFLDYAKREIGPTNHSRELRHAREACRRYRQFGETRGWITLGAFTLWCVVRPGSASHCTNFAFSVNIGLSENREATTPAHDVGSAIRLF